MQIDLQNYLPHYVQTYLPKKCIFIKSLCFLQNGDGQLCIERQLSVIRDMDHLVLSGVKDGVNFAYGTAIIADITSESVLHRCPKRIIYNSDIQAAKINASTFTTCAVSEFLNCCS